MQNIKKYIELFVLRTEDAVEYVLKLTAILFMLAVSWAIISSTIYYLFAQ